MNIEIFLGRFHPLIVHLPIGFVLLAFLMMLWAKRSKSTSFHQAISFSLLLGAASALGSVILGWLLASDGGYDDSTLFWHRWLGIGVALLTIFAWLVNAGKIKASQRVLPATLWVSVILIGLTGHFGGVLTHGSTYLVQYAPGFIQKMLSENATANEDISLPSQPDSIAVYQHLIAPIINNKCVACHNESKKKGGLILTSQEDILNGGEQGEVVMAGDPYESGLFQRVVLPQTSKKFMPPKGEPLTYSEIKLLEWWISGGASFDEKLLDKPLPKEIETLLLKDFHVSVTVKPYYERVAVEPASAESIDKLTAVGFSTKPLSADNNFLQVELTADSPTFQQIEALLEVSEQITWLNLGGKGITDAMLPVIGKLPNLTKLSIEQNEITDEGVQELRKLAHLQYLNLYGTKISDKALESIKEINSLNSLYVWQTDVSQEAIEALNEDRPNLTIDSGFQFENVN
ncbi:c-type cytochrome domain-containing protein [Fulvivirgaceae bacterium BMA12]|uniref:C-type cytochrome domain-containing protein n=1 Tax=Agaribacillus aureus TaxID=3051825 RepID=A0ABT8L6Z3_9BACT|nr:c-type cytochrome domain-containing protein [Fulvivirgaceae bacterium BMA12]